ncbi:MAG: zinc ribbon domain-containing protein [Thermoanaerobaculales bacterium]|jgi:putative FmdB family regulatory protein|nr:zinc ribbon domain-containing protein [Thermoanaerobaculales bacterium]
MPVYEFLCTACNRIFSFHSFKVDPDKTPRCPKCAAEDLRRVPSRFGVSASSKTSSQEGGGDGFDDPRMEREMMKLAADLEGMDENDPRQMAAAVRRMTELAGEKVTPAMEEMIRRLEAGEDPERIEEELGDAIEEEMGGDGAFGGAPPTRDEGLYPM